MTQALYAHMNNKKIKIKKNAKKEKKDPSLPWYYLPKTITSIYS
jgi:hypothetical protein